MSTSTANSISVASLFLTQDDIDNILEVEGSGKWTTLYTVLDRVRTNAKTLSELIDKLLQHPRRERKHVLQALRDVSECCKNSRQSACALVEARLKPSDASMIPALAALSKECADKIPATQNISSAMRRAKPEGKISPEHMMAQVRVISDQILKMHGRLSLLSLVTDECEMGEASNLEGTKDESLYRDWIRKIEEAGSTLVKVLQSDTFRDTLGERNKDILEQVREQIRLVRSDERSEFESLASTLVHPDVIHLFRPMRSLVDVLVAKPQDWTIDTEAVSSLGQLMRDCAHGPDEEETDDENKIERVKQMVSFTEELGQVVDFVCRDYFADLEGNDKISLLTLLIQPGDISAKTVISIDEALFRDKVRRGWSQLTAILGKLKDSQAATSADGRLYALAGRVSSVNERQNPSLVDYEMLHRSDVAALPKLQEFAEASEEFENTATLRSLLMRVIEASTVVYDSDNKGSPSVFDKWRALEYMREATPQLLMSNFSLSPEADEKLQGTVLSFSELKRAFSAIDNDREDQDRDSETAKMA